MTYVYHYVARNTSNNVHAISSRGNINLLAISSQGWVGAKGTTMKYCRPLVVSFISLLVGCSTGSSLVQSGSKVSDGGIAISISSLNCAKKIDFNGRKINLNGLDVPIGTAGTDIVKLSGFSIEPTKVRDVTERMVALDDHQYENCLLLLSAEKNHVVTADMITNFYQANQDFYKFALSVMAPDSKPSVAPQQTSSSAPSSAPSSHEPTH